MKDLRIVKDLDESLRSALDAQQITTHSGFMTKRFRCLKMILAMTDTQKVVFDSLLTKSVHMHTALELRMLIDITRALTIKDHICRIDTSALLAYIVNPVSLERLQQQMAHNTASSARIVHRFSSQVNLSVADAYELLMLLADRILIHQAREAA